MKISKASNNTKFGKKKLDINQLKQKFFDYLAKNNKEINASELMSSDVSVFLFSGEFQKFLSKEGQDLGLDKNFSGSISDILNLTYDNDKEEIVAGKNATDEQKNLVNLVNDLFKNEDVKTAADNDSDGKLSRDEMNGFLKKINNFDEDNDNLSLNDFFSAINGLKDGTFNPKDDTSISLGEPFAGGTSGVDSAGSLPSSSSNPVYGNNGVPATQLQTKSSPTETSDGQYKDIKEIDRKIAEKNNEITSLNSEKAEAYSGNQEYKTLVNSLNDAEKAISDSSANISQFEQELHQTQTEISSKQAELDNLQDPQIFTEYKDEISSKKSELTAAIKSLKEKEEATKEKIANEKKTLADKETEKSNLEKQISEFEKDNPNDKIKEINSKIETLKSDINSLKKEKADKENEIKNTREQEKSDAAVYGKMTAYRQSEFVKYMMDYATSTETANRYNNARHNGAWCAVFTSEVTEKLYAEAAKRLGISTNQSQSLSGNQVAMHATAWGRGIQEALTQAGINKQATINISNMSLQERKDAVRKGLIYPGMTFEYEANGGYHTGFIESINADLTWNTIEGNSTGGKVGANRRDATNNRLTSVTDTTLKVYYWLLQKGYSAQQVNNMLYNV